MYALIRSSLLFILAVACIILVAVHGFVRGVVVLGAILLLTTAPRTRAWQATERWLVRLTGSRRRAAVVVGMILIGALAALNIYNLLHQGG